LEEVLMAVFLVSGSGCDTFLLLQVTENFTLKNPGAGDPVVFVAMLWWTKQACANAGWPTVHADKSHFNRHLLDRIQLWLLFTLLPEHIPSDGVKANRVAQYIEL